MGSFKRALVIASTLLIPFTAGAADNARWSNSSNHPAPYSETSNPISIDIIDDRGRYYQKHQHRDNYKNHRAYLEAKEGKNYSIRVRNRTGKRLAVVIAVDGRNILTGKKSHLKSNERMYVLGPYQSATYKGWRTGQNKINRFFFTDAGNSYSAAWGDYSAMGVISAAVYKEKERHQYQPFGFRESQGKAARRGLSASEDAGTGFGNEEYSASRQVSFEPETYHSGQYFYKYEWRDSLCKRGVISCYASNNNHYNGNRFWPFDNNAYGAYVPYPPNYRR